MNKFIIITTVLFIFYQFGNCEEGSQVLPFCAVCKCKFTDDSPYAKVTCDNDVKSLMQDMSTWINSKNNLSYPYSELSLVAQDILFLNFTFPPSNLTYLSFSGSNIFQIMNSPFKNLQQLKTLILSDTGIEILLPDAFKGVYLEERLMPLRSLKVLNLSHNKLHTLNANLFEHTTDLEILDLSYNPLKILDKHTTVAIDSLTFLKELYLGYTQITTLPDQFMHTPRYLSILDLSGNPISEIPETLGESYNLTFLNLNDTDFVTINKKNGFPQLPKLKTLYLCNLKQLERIESGALSGLSFLNEVHICNNIKLTHIDEFAMATINENGGTIWPMVKKLNLYNNKLSYLDSDTLSRWDLLQEVNLNENPWTCECENQWLVDEFVPLYRKLDNDSANSVRCGAPVEMVGETLANLYDRQYKMRCLDLYDARPENDAMMLVGVLVGVLIALPVILFAIFAYQRKWFGLFNMCDNSPASYSRRFYSSTAKDEDF